MQRVLAQPSVICFLCGISLQISQIEVSLWWILALNIYLSWVVALFFYKTTINNRCGFLVVEKNTSMYLQIKSRANQKTLELAKTWKYLYLCYLLKELCNWENGSSISVLAYWQTLHSVPCLLFTWPFGNKHTLFGITLYVLRCHFITSI